MKFHDYPSCGSWIIICERTDGRDDLNRRPSRIQMRLRHRFPATVSLLRMVLSINSMKPLIFVMEVHYVFCGVGSHFVNFMYMNLGFRRVDVASHFITMHFTFLLSRCKSGQVFVRWCLIHFVAVWTAQASLHSKEHDTRPRILWGGGGRLLPLKWPSVRLV